jgi:hypothetical protein
MKSLYWEEPAIGVRFNVAVLILKWKIDWRYQQIILREIAFIRGEIQLYFRY